MINYILLGVIALMLLCGIMASTPALATVSDARAAAGAHNFDAGHDAQCVFDAGSSMTQQDCAGAVPRICQALPPVCRAPGVTSYCVYYQHGQAALLPISCAGTPAPAAL